jgi:predicted GIY-YIG superfamily endonuclease
VNALATFYVYMLRCGDGSLYLGHTDDLETRMEHHDIGDFSEYTARRRPLTLVWSHEVPTRDDAFALERKLKKWSRAKKEALIVGDWKRISDLAHGRRPSLDAGSPSANPCSG